MNREVKERFMKKYNKELNTLSKEKDIDMGVAIDVLVAHARNRDKAPEELSSDEYYYRFTGSDILDYKELDADIIELENEGVIPTFEA